MKTIDEDQFDLAELFERINPVRFTEIQIHVATIWAEHGPTAAKIVSAFGLLDDTLTKDTREEEAFCIGTQVGMLMTVEMLMAMEKMKRETIDKVANTIIEDLSR